MCAVTIDGVEGIFGAQGDRGMSVGWQRVSVCVNVCRVDVKHSRSGRIIHRDIARRARPRIRPAKPVRLLEPFVYRMVQSCPPDPSQAAVSRTGTARARILVVDDDPGMRSLLKVYLGDSGFAVETAGDGAAMWQLLAHGMPDAIVLDLMLPGEDGLSLARRLRDRSNVPILMLSARGEEIDRVVGLEMGADDYLAKPFSPRELLARLRALLRRSQARVPAVAPAASAAFGPYRLDIASHRLTRDGVEIKLSTAESALLRILVEHPLRVLSRDTLIDMLKGYERDPFDRSVDTRVTRLRRKIEANPGEPVYIRTVRGEGYLFNPRGSEA